jgi:hypothetical protein
LNLTIVHAALLHSQSCAVAYARTADGGRLHGDVGAGIGAVEREVLSGAADVLRI